MIHNLFRRWASRRNLNAACLPLCEPQPSSERENVIGQYLLHLFLAGKGIILFPFFRGVGILGTPYLSDVSLLPRVVEGCVRGSFLCLALGA